MTKQKDNSVEQNDIEIKQAYKLVFKAIKLLNTAVTKADIQLKTGLSLFHVEDALNLIMQDYPCELLVSDKGQIVYKFNLKHKRKANSFRKQLTIIFNYTSKLFLFVFKLITTLVFFSYALTIGLAIAIILVGLTKSIQPVLMIFVAVYYGFTMLFTDTKLFFSNELPDNTRKTKNLIIMVLGYAFGNRKSIDTLEQDKNILAYIKQQNNIITATDLMLITGWTKQKCNQELTLMLTHYRGKVSVTDNGVILYSFPEFDKQMAKAEKELHKFYIWNHPMQQVPYNYNDKTTNKVIGAVAWISLIIAFLSALIFGYENHISILSPTNLLDILLLKIQYSYVYMSYSEGLWLSGFVYLFFFFLFFVLSAQVSKLKNKKENRKRFENNKSSNYLFKIFSSLPYINPDVLSELDEKTQSYFVYDTGGDYKYNEQKGELYIDYSMLYEELNEVSSLRSHATEYDFGRGNNDALIEIKKIQKEKKVQIWKQIEKRKRRVKFFSFAAIIVLFVSFSKDIIPVLKANMSSGMSDNLTVNYQSKLFPFINQANYGHFKTLTLLNASAKNPIKWPKSLDYTKRLFIVNCSDSIKIPQAPYLETLSLTNCGLTSIPESVYKNEYIRELYLNNNALSSLPQKLLSLSKLWDISVKNNKLDSLPLFLLEFKNLFDLNIEQNNITSIDHFLANAKKCPNLNLSKNKLTSLPKNIWSIKMSDINLSNNLLSRLPEVNIDTSAIFVLNLQGNLIKEFPKGLERLPFLSNLNLADNQIKQIPDNINNFRNLRRLTIDNNQIVELPENLGECTKLSFLSIQNNPIIKVSPNLSKLNEDYNPCKVIINKKMDKGVIENVIKYFGKDEVVVKD